MSKYTELQNKDFENPNIPKEPTLDELIMSMGAIKLGEGFYLRTTKEYVKVRQGILRLEKIDSIDLDDTLEDLSEINMWVINDEKYEIIKPSFKSLYKLIDTIKEAQDD